jgi:subtilase family serine protease
MKSSRALFLPLAFSSVLLIPSCLTALAQETTVPPQATEAVGVNELVTLRGNTHPLARPEFDRGAAPDSQPIRRMLLILERSPEQEAELRRLLDEQQTKSSPNFHHWLTPQEFGQRFGPADADIQAVTDWLISEGFEVSRVAAGRTVIEFSGTAGQVRQAFHTEIHKFEINGEEHFANTTDPRIPAGLAPRVKGIASLNNFPRIPMIRRPGAFQRSKATGEVRPLFTYAISGGTVYPVGPTDFATIYNVLPLWNAGIDGRGVTIAIVGESNINLQDVRAFRTMWGLPTNDPAIVLDGPDPGVLFGTPDETESDLDVEWSGAVAKGATIDFVVSESTESSAGVDLSALYIIDTNLAAVMSEGYGTCELFLGAGGNAFYSSLWEQASAQGITVTVAAGDQGSAACDSLPGETAAQYGAMVNGIASTPFNVAVGGTDFNDFGAWSTYWNSTNTPTTNSSALSYIPETTWNDSCARLGLDSQCPTSTTAGGLRSDLTAGSGGPSNCTSGTISSPGPPPVFTCSGGYAKPSWQTGTGVPNDRVRDLPDVSLFASDGLSNSFYVICELDLTAALGGSATSCDLNSPYTDFIGLGGTSASSPAFAGIMAMVNQKYGRQGNANYVLYKLAAQRGLWPQPKPKSLG